MSAVIRGGSGVRRTFEEQEAPWKAQLREVCRRLPEDALPHTSVTYLEKLKGSALVFEVHRLGSMLGCEQQVIARMLPLLLHLEGLVYRADLAYEAEQRGGGPAGTEWLRGMRTVLAAHDLDTPRVEAQLSALREYFEEETRVVTGAVELDEAGLRELTHKRSSDLRLLTCVTCLHTGHAAELDKVLWLLDPLVALREIASDLRSYRADCEEGTFNTLREYVRLHGKDEAFDRLGAEWGRLTGELGRRWRTAPRAWMPGLWAVAFGPLPGSRGLLLRIPPQRTVAGWIERRLPRPEDYFTDSVA
ncbi:hypothetical protein [Streptomyces albus]|uniref:hypothetical protein n=1 Tax=Streptomyces sp. NRRL F-5639 TaxID=1463867 RepID=UPI0004C71859|nr:hypothetical protein [Streptomyces sp. NRRL F-5639]